jgi:hypothetical protein
MPKRRTTSKPPSVKQLRSRAINGVLFLLNGVAGNIIAQGNRLCSEGTFYRSRTFLNEAHRNILLAIESIKKER